ncbi:MAG: TraR/DksA C4-type zinc finger protein [Verrucomicrobiota bacterium]|nr:TraR/DksA C4-type zinc finger protein [Verrucomicrobiota bacterium]
MILELTISFNMDSERLDFFRKRLETLRLEIEGNMSTNKDDTGVVELDSSIGRLSRMDALQNQQIALELKRRQENQLLRIKNAIKRMDKGQYGFCGKCKKSIEEDRLEIFPDTFTCINCA